MRTVNKPYDREERAAAHWDEMLARWNELSWCAHAFQETDVVAAKILLWKDLTCEQPRIDVPADGGESDTPRRSSTLPEGLRVVRVGGRAVWWLLLSTATAVGRVLR